MYFKGLKYLVWRYSRRARDVPTLRQREQYERGEHSASDRHGHARVVYIVNFISAWNFWVPLPYRDDKNVG